MSRPLGGTSCSVFVGNVPYDAQEDEMRDLFSKVAPCTSVRLVHDKETRQPKGYAFADFGDSSAVAAAIDKLNNIEYNGRSLRISYAERELSQLGKGEGKAASGPSALPGPSGMPGMMDPVAILPPVTTVADRLARIREQEAAEHARQAALEQWELVEIARFVETLTPAQLFHIVGEMQRLTLSAPEVARALLTENIQLCIALQHAQFLLGLADEPPLPTDPEVRERAKNVKEKVFGASPSTGAGTLGMGMNPAAMPTQLAPGFMGLATAAAVRPGFMPTAGIGGLPIDLTGSGALPPPAPAAGDPLISKLVQLTPAQIDQLPHHTKVQVLQYLQTLTPQAA